MSRPKHYWYGIVRKMIIKSKQLPNENSMQSAIFLNAMREASAETLKLPNGELRMKAVTDVLVNNTKSIEEVGSEVHYEHRTVQGWINSYVNLVGKRAGW